MSRLPCRRHEWNRHSGFDLAAVVCIGHEDTPGLCDIPDAEVDGPRSPPVRRSSTRTRLGYALLSSATADPTESTTVACAGRSDTLSVASLRVGTGRMKMRRPPFSANCSSSFKCSFAVSAKAALLLSRMNAALYGAVRHRGLRLPRSGFHLHSGSPASLRAGALTVPGTEHRMRLSPA